VSGPGFYPEPHAVDAAVLRSLYDALWRARPYVERAGDVRYFGEARYGQVTAREVLEAVDAAIADAGELLEGERS
jgi:hypothetical protein